MDFIPFGVMRVLYERPADCYMGPDRWDRGVVREPNTCRLRITLRHGKMAHNLEHEIAAFLGFVARVQETGERGIDVEPTVSVAIWFMAYTVRPVHLLRLRG